MKGWYRVPLRHAPVNVGWLQDLAHCNSRWVEKRDAANDMFCAELTGK